MLLSLLDQSPVSEGSTASDALQNTINLAQHAERLGYHRFWVAEHHNSEGLAGSSPEIMIGAIASATETIRVGSAGVMLTHYSPYKVAENFRVLEALHPGRIDLGLGRAPGSDHMTMQALARGGTPLGIEYYPAQVAETIEFLDDNLPDSHPLRMVHALPQGDTTPDIWLLSSSPDSASIAAHLGLPLGWAHFFAGSGPGPVIGYRRQYTPSAKYPSPKVSLAVGAICAATKTEAEYLASSVRAWRRRGLRGAIPAPTQPQFETTTDAALPDPLAIQTGRPAKPLTVGTPDQVVAEIQQMADEYEADEVVIVTICHDHAARVRSYELIAQANGQI